MYLFLAAGLFCVSTAHAQLCQSLFDSGHRSAYLARKAEVNEDIWLRNTLENEYSSKAEMRGYNNEMLAKLQTDIPVQRGKRKQAATELELQQLLSILFYHKMGVMYYDKYNREGTDIGYCFGRATYIHLKLLSMGLQKDSIQKIWAVGPMNSGNVNWRYHVATMAYTKTKGWLVVDDYVGQIVTVKEWTAYMETKSINGKLRFYNTDASKFGLSDGVYSRYELGLDLGNLDYYKSYFKDMMIEMKKEIKSSKNKSYVEESPLWQSLNDFVN